MSDMLSAITPKSDQLNYDDLIGGVEKTIKITKVSIGKHEQPVAINYEGDNGKPYKPCKSMCRVLVHIWGPDAKKYTGRTLTLFGDPTVAFGGQKVGGIRISHMSDITEPKTMALTATRASRKPFTVQPLVMTGNVDSIESSISYMTAADTGEELAARFSSACRAHKDDSDRQKIIAAKDKRKKELTAIKEPTDASLS